MAPEVLQSEGYGRRETEGRTVEPEDLQGSSLTVDEVTAWVESLGEVVTLRPQPGGGSEKVAWGYALFYYAPDGALPLSHPFATIVTKDYPDEPAAGLGGDVFRVNIDAGRRNQDLPVTIPSTTSSAPARCTGR